MSVKKMFSVLLLIPSLTFFVLGSHLQHVIRTIATDVLRSILCRGTQVAQIQSSAVISSRGTNSNITNNIRVALSDARLKHPLAKQHMLTLKEEIKPAFIAIRYRANERTFIRYYSRGKRLLFPPCLSTVTDPPQVQAYLLQHFTPGEYLHKQIRWDISKQIEPLLGPRGDWFDKEGSQKRPLVVYHYLRTTIERIVRQEFLGVSSDQLKVTLKVQRPVQTSIPLTRYINRRLQLSREDA